MINSTRNDARYVRLLHWGKVLSITGSAQIIIQAIGFICGIIVIRLLPTDEYAFYTISNTMLGTMSMLSDGGISLGVMSEGGKVWQDKIKLGVVLSTGLNLRRKFAVICLFITVPILVYMLHHHGASILLIFLIICSIVPAFFSTLSGNILEIPLKLHQDITPLQKIQLLSNVGRMCLLGLTIFVFPWAFVAILASGLPQLWANRKLNKVSRNIAVRDNSTDKTVEKSILSLVKRVLPDALYYSISGQISLWLISFFGTTSSVAQIGALGRLSMLLTMITVVFTTLIPPRFAKLPEKRSVLLKNFLLVFGGLIITVGSIVVLTWVFSEQILWVLGAKYKGLDKEVVLMMISSCFYLISTIIFRLCTSRGWAISPVLSVPISILSIVGGVFFIKIDTLAGILMLNIITAAVAALIHLTYSFYKIYKVQSGDS